MPRVIKGSATRKARKRILKRVKGHRGGPGRQYRLAKERAVRSEVFARVGRKLKKRQYRALWIIRLTAACRMRKIRYSQLINGLKKASIALNRKMLSEIAIFDPAAFDAIVEKAKIA
ncbi:MAG: 50S ribosomal protein L20 [Planctomycetaceae bacterium]|jgi:large subunit ribosomal protein L20|nr:50S ribosomal protein L20 [Planctomycetaceae bacterium]